VQCGADRSDGARRWRPDYFGVCSSFSLITWFWSKAQLGRRQIHATRETVTMAALKLDYSVLDAPQRATDRIEADL
jgi:hypothetical protein